MSTPSSSSSDHASVRITAFDGQSKNIKQWKVDLTVALASIGIASHLKSSRPSASSSAKSESKSSEKLDELYGKSFAILWSSLAPSVKSLYYDTIDTFDTFTLYSAILERYEQLTMYDRTVLLRAIVNARLLPSESIELFIARMNAMSNQLSTAGDPVSLSQLKFFILEALPDSYNVVREMLRHSPDYDSMTVQQIEKRLLEQQSRDKHTNTEQSYFIGNKTKTSNKSNNVVCFRCGESGHITRDCTVDPATLTCKICDRQKHNEKGHVAHEQHYALAIML